jgi:CHAT domain-containing protein/Tfp pilus assembly protein PilF
MKIYLSLLTLAGAVVFSIVVVVKSVALQSRVSAQSAGPRPRSDARQLSDAQQLLRLGEEEFENRQLRAARQSWEAALAEFQADGDRAGVGKTQFNLGQLYRKVGRYDQAFESFDQALSIARELDNLPAQLRILEQIGRTYRRLGQFPEAAANYEEILDLARLHEDQATEAKALSKLGLAYHRFGNYQQSLDVLTQALSIVQALRYPPGASETLTTLGNLYESLGDDTQAQEYYQQSLEIAQNAGDREREGNALNALGLLEHRLGNSTEAMNRHQQAIEIALDLNNPKIGTQALNYLGNIYVDQGEWTKAITSYEDALRLASRRNYLHGELTALSNLGLVYGQQGDSPQAIDYQERALTIAQQIQHRPDEAVILMRLGTAILSQDPQRGVSTVRQALEPIEAAIDIFETLRSNLISPELKTSYFATINDYYKLYIDLLMRLDEQESGQGYDVEALHVSERARARSLLDLLEEAQVDIRQGVLLNLLEKEQRLQNQLDAIETYRIEVLSEAGEEADLSTLDREHAQLLSEYQTVLDQIRTQSPRYASLTQPQPLTLTQIQQSVLDSDTALLQYSLGQERSFLWVVTASNITSYWLAPGSEIEDQVVEFLEILKLDGSGVPRQAMSQAIFPLKERLSQKRLLIVADGALHYLPFNLLPIGEATERPPESSSPRLETNALLLHLYEMVYSPSASVLEQLQQTSMALPDKTIAIFADPVFSTQDDRVATVHSSNTSVLTPSQVALNQTSRVMDANNWARLIGTRLEAERISALLPGIEHTVRLDFSANLEALTTALLSQHQILHLATHGFANSDQPELSGVVLSLVDEQGQSQNGFLRLHEVFNLNLASTQLVVLSACQTGLGASKKGEGLVGLTRGFMYAGSPSVIVSLWNVDDRATAELMEYFYQYLWQEGLPPSAALQAAQLELQQSSEWNHPKYWAAFVLQGRWQ